LFKWFWMNFVCMGAKWFIFTILKEFSID
jgi:hypothetical protein